ncbi:hypothetical protein C0J52_22144 [Blattella germanica]|nr:hypothetical protein C0J52_22144 [Blattella germanica]
MLRGIRRTWKQVIAYYFTSNTIKGYHLKALIIHVICEIQKCGLKIVATVCDQNATNVKALKELCEANVDKPSKFHFVINNEPIAVIYDMPHILKNTRNALVNHNIQFDAHKFANFDYIK